MEPISAIVSLLLGLIAPVGIVSDRIAENQNNNFKNRQQKELRSVRRKLLLTIYGLSISNESKDRWNRAEIYARFAKDEESKLVLDEAFIPPGKVLRVVED